MSMYCKTDALSLGNLRLIKSCKIFVRTSYSKWPSNYSRIPYAVNEWSVPNGGGGVKRGYVGRIKDLTLVSLWLVTKKPSCPSLSVGKLSKSVNQPSGLLALQKHFYDRSM